MPGPTCGLCARVEVTPTPGQPYEFVQRHIAYTMMPTVIEGMAGYLCPMCTNFRADYPVDGSRIHGPARANEWPPYVWPVEARQAEFSVIR